LTLPVGVPDPGLAAVTVAVSVTAWHNTEGLADDARTVVLLALLMLTLKLVVPLL
jgi:hypothetical protein